MASIERDGEGFRVATSAGTVQARQVLVYTNGYSDRAVPLLMARLMPKRMMIEERQLGFYYRLSPGGMRILLGGATVPTRAIRTRQSSIYV